MSPVLKRLRPIAITVGCAVKSVLKAADLPNGVWYELQLGGSSPWPGSWELHALRGDVFLTVEGVDSKAHLEQVAGELTQEWS